MTLSIHTIKASVGSRRSTKKRGRGNASGHGNYSGRGGKGQTARSGGQRGLRLKAFKDLFQSTPKLRGFKSLQARDHTVRLSDLEKVFQAGDQVTLATLKEKNIVGKNAKTAKIIDTGELKKKLSITGIKCSAGAKAKIEKVGGEIK